MLAWEKFGNGETPKLLVLKGDKLVGNYYVEFDKNYKAQISELKEQGFRRRNSRKNKRQLFLKLKKCFSDWEQENKQVRDLWEKYEFLGLCRV